LLDRIPHRAIGEPTRRRRLGIDGLKLQGFIDAWKI
jgi:hypothetical protein